jgi:hypothetical protein
MTVQFFAKLSAKRASAYAADKTAQDCA